MNKQYLARLGATLSALCLLTACGKNKAPDPPEEYALGGEQVAALHTVLDEEASWALAAMDTPETREEEETGEERSVYTYEKMKKAGGNVERYVEWLTAEAQGFWIMDGEDGTAQTPDYQENSGSVALARTASEEGRILRLDISWEKSGCQVLLTCPAWEAPREEAESMTYNDAVNYIKSLPASALGLEGDMAGYSVYPMDGAVMVDGNLCLKLQVYPPHGEEEANVIAGTYLLSGDKAHLYCLKDKMVEELHL